MKKTFLIFSVLFIMCSFNENGQKNGLNCTLQKGNRIMKLEFDTNKKYLELKRRTALKISFENIYINGFSIEGVGIQMCGGGKNFTKLKISPVKKYLVNNQLEISLFEERNGKKELFRKLLIPVKVD
ncbi:hypothetical protein EOD40_04685 [Flavobacterium sufflavum]|uniref:Uncharacterized protein n=1 Tax=Flavobacterium sufflavum TaxID=1921138 RepID=A0A3S2U535_9FLAO|nr:hypothetical protein [Flavobacterium sufflavum]RVT78535.1 hypothetical protein EOD40_04685 [Flavobacterium sufflavum]